MHVDASHSPDLLFLRFNTWPNPDERALIADSLEACCHLMPHTRALVDLRTVTQQPTPPEFAEGMRQLFGKKWTRELAVLAESDAQAACIDAAEVKELPHLIGWFETAPAAIAWLQR